MSVINSILTNHFEMKEKRGWDKTYWFFDIHSTIVKPNYKAGEIPTEFYPNAKETLQYLNNLDDVCMILYTCSHPHEILEYKKFFESHGINFIYTNKNPEIKTDLKGYGCYDDKPYINVLFDDKAGFKGESDWLPVLKLMKHKYSTESPKELSEDDNDQLFCELENDGLGYWVLNHSHDWEKKDYEMGVLISEAKKALMKLENYLENKGVLN